MLHPITFSIAEEKIYKGTTDTLISNKKKVLSNLIPGDFSTYIYSNEKDYYDEYRESYFAITKKKSGWDCMRHYEILANGCIPYFIDIENCPKNTMALCPKDLFVDANNLYNTKFVNKNINEIIQEDINEYKILLDKLLEYTRTQLTTKKMAEYILQKTNFTNVTKILYLSGNTDPDYLRCVTLHGFKELFGSNCHDYPKIQHVYKSDSINYHNLYGRGITYTNLLESTFHNDELDSSVEKDIENKYYDIIMYGSWHRGTPYYDLVSRIYKPNEIILLCGEDLHSCNYNDFLNNGNNVFVREL